MNKYIKRKDIKYKTDMHDKHSHKQRGGGGVNILSYLYSDIQRKNFDEPYFTP